MNGRTLYRSRTNRVIAGVFGGLGEYLNVDPNILRILSIFVPGINLLVYLIAAILIPEQPY